MTELLLVCVVLASAYALFCGDLLYGVIALSVASVVSALLFYLFHAPDVAITEAAVGAGLSTVIYVWAIRRTDRRDRQ